MTAYTQPILSDDDLFRLTLVEQPAAQRKALDRAGIKYIKRKDGRPITTWGLVEAAVGQATQSNDPDFSGINGG